MSKKSDNLKLEFQWGTFCRKVLEVPDRPERSLIDVLSGLTIEIVVKVKGDQSRLPELFTLDLGDLAVFGAFKVNPGNTEMTDVPLSVVISLPDRELKEASVMKIDPKITFSNQVNRMYNVMVRIPFKAGLQEHNLKLTWNIDDDPIGSVELPVRVDFKVEPL